MIKTCFKSPHDSRSLSPVSHRNHPPKANFNQSKRSPMTDLRWFFVPQKGVFKADYEVVSWVLVLWSSGLSPRVPARQPAPPQPSQPSPQGDTHPMLCLSYSSKDHYPDPRNSVSKGRRQMGKINRHEEAGCKLSNEIWCFVRECFSMELYVLIEEPLMYTHVLSIKITKLHSWYIVRPFSHFGNFLLRKNWKLI